MRRQLRHLDRQLTWIALVESVGWLMALAGWLAELTGLLVFGLVVALVTLFALGPLIVLERLGRRRER